MRISVRTIAFVASITSSLISPYGVAEPSNTAPQTSESSQPKNGKLALNKDGIKVWTFKGTSSSALNYRASTIMETTLSKAAAVVMDVAYLPNWVPYVSAADVIEMDAQAGTFLLRMEFDFPFPLRNRDVVVAGKMVSDVNSVTITSHAVSDPRVPASSHLIRITQYEGSWLLQKKDERFVSVTTQGFANPAGGLPLSVVNMFVETQPFLMLQNMRLQVKQSRYKNL